MVCQSGKTITRVEPTIDGKGEVKGMRRRVFGVSGDGIRLRAGRRYRVVAEYNNTTGSALVNGGMAHMVGLFAPDDLSKLPPIDPEDPTYRRDMESLEARGAAGHHDK